MLKDFAEEFKLNCKQSFTSRPGWLLRLRRKFSAILWKVLGPGGPRFGELPINLVVVILGRLIRKLSACIYRLIWTYCPPSLLLIHFEVVRWVPCPNHLQLSTEVICLSHRISALFRLLQENLSVNKLLVILDFLCLKLKTAWS